MVRPCTEGKDIELLPYEHGVGDSGDKKYIEDAEKILRDEEAKAGRTPNIWRFKGTCEYKEGTEPPVIKGVFKRLPVISRDGAKVQYETWIDKHARAIELDATRVSTQLEDEGREALEQTELELKNVAGAAGNFGSSTMTFGLGTELLWDAVMAPLTAGGDRSLYASLVKDGELARLMADEGCAGKANQSIKKVFVNSKTWLRVLKIFVKVLVVALHGALMWTPDLAKRKEEERKVKGASINTEEQKRRREAEKQKEIEAEFKKIDGFSLRELESYSRDLEGKVTQELAKLKAASDDLEARNAGYRQSIEERKKKHDQIKELEKRIKYLETTATLLGFGFGTKLFELILRPLPGHSHLAAKRERIENNAKLRALAEYQKQCGGEPKKEPPNPDDPKGPKKEETRDFAWVARPNGQVVASTNGSASAPPSQISQGQAPSLIQQSPPPALRSNSGFWNGPQQWGVPVTSPGPWAAGRAPELEPVFPPSLETSAPLVSAPSPAPQVSAPQVQTSAPQQPASSAPASQPSTTAAQGASAEGGVVDQLAARRTQMRRPQVVAQRGQSRVVASATGTDGVAGPVQTGTVTVKQRPSGGRVYSGPRGGGAGPQRVGVAVGGRPAGVAPVRPGAAARAPNASPGVRPNMVSPPAAIRQPSRPVLRLRDSSPNPVSRGRVGSQRISSRMPQASTPRNIVRGVRSPNPPAPVSTDINISTNVPARLPTVVPNRLSTAVPEVVEASGSAPKATLNHTYIAPGIRVATPGEVPPVLNRVWNRVGSVSLSSLNVTSKIAGGIGYVQMVDQMAEAFSRYDATYEASVNRRVSDRVNDYLARQGDANPVIKGEMLLARFGFAVSRAVFHTGVEQAVGALGAQTAAEIRKEDQDMVPTLRSAIAEILCQILIPHDKGAYIDASCLRIDHIPPEIIEDPLFRNLQNTPLEKLSKVLAQVPQKQRELYGLALISLCVTELSQRDPAFIETIKTSVKREQAGRKKEGFEVVLNYVMPAQIKNPEEKKFWDKVKDGKVLCVKEGQQLV